MADLKQLAIVKNLAEKKEQAALNQFSSAQQQLQQMQAQMKALSDYKKEYLLQMSPSQNQQVSANKLILIQGFLAKIDQSISQQRDVIARASVAVDSRRQEWLKAKQYTESIVFLINKQLKQADTLAHKQEQKLSDEFAMMSFHRKRNAEH